MSRGSGVQRVLDRLAGGQPTAMADDPISRMIARTAETIQPQRAYRWRLRGQLVNQYVAVREGLAPEVPQSPARMGSLGRAVLFASVGLAISVSAVGAASTSALPGDPLYAVKRQVEELRMEIAPPSVRPALAAMALEERLSEVEQLAAAGNWSRVAQGEAEVDAAVAMLQELGAPLTAGQVVDLTRHTQVLTALLARAPAAAQPGLERALLAWAGVAATANSGKHLAQGNTNDGSGTASGVSNGGGNRGSGANGPNPGGGKPRSDEGGTNPTPSPSQALESRSPHPRNSPAPHPSPRPTASASSKSEATPPAH